MPQFKNTRELLESWPGLDEEERAALLSAISTRGKYKGYLLSSAPPNRTGLKAIAWQAMIGELAPVRASIWAMMIMSEAEKTFYHQLERKLSGDLGVALRAQEPPYRWNLYAHHVDINIVREAAYKLCKKGESHETV